MKPGLQDATESLHIDKKMNYTVDALRDALSVLMHVAQAPGLGVTELAKRSGNTKARAFRFLCTLEQYGFVQRGPTDTQYILGYASLVLGLAAQEQVSLSRIAQKYLNGLGSQFNEIVQIRVRDGLMAVCICKWESSQGIRVHTELGSRRPLHAGASSKVLLAYAPEEIQSLVLSGELHRFTPQTLVQRTKLSKELQSIRSEGIAISRGEVTTDVVAIAVPIFDGHGVVSAALGMSIPASRAPSDLGSIVSALKVTSLRLSQELGWRGEQQLAPTVTVIASPTRAAPASRAKTKPKVKSKV